LLPNNFKFKFYIYLDIFLLNVTVLSSFKYNDLRIVNTYAWIQATANSKHKSNIKLTINTKIIKPLTAGPWEPKSVSNRCPATILAASRIESVPGRITFLTVSIITIIGINIVGVPLGTKWANSLLYWFFIENNIVPIQIGKANVNVKDIWLDLVKIYGASPIKLQKKIKKKNLKKINTVPGKATNPNTADNSS